MNREQKNLYVGAENELRLSLRAINEGEGAYEAEIQVSLPPEADYVGFTRIRVRPKHLILPNQQTRLTVNLRAG